MCVYLFGNAKLRISERKAKYYFEFFRAEVTWTKSKLQISERKAKLKNIKIQLS